MGKKIYRVFVDAIEDNFEEIGLSHIAQLNVGDDLGGDFYQAIAGVGGEMNESLPLGGAFVVVPSVPVADGSWRPMLTYLTNDFEDAKSIVRVCCFIDHTPVIDYDGRSEYDRSIISENICVDEKYIPNFLK